jgi:hypothetical protein
MPPSSYGDRHKLYWHQLYYFVFEKRALAYNGVIRFTRVVACGVHESNHILLSTEIRSKCILFGSMLPFSTELNHTSLRLYVYTPDRLTRHDMVYLSARTSSLPFP